MYIYIYIYLYIYIYIYIFIYIYTYIYIYITTILGRGSGDQRAGRCKRDGGNEQALITQRLTWRDINQWPL